MSYQNSDRLLPGYSTVEQSPMTEISINLSGTKLSDTPVARNQRFCGPLEDNDLASVLNDENAGSHQRRSRPSSRRENADAFLRKRGPLLTHLGNESPLRQDSDISLYDGSTPKQISPVCSPLRSNVRTKTPLADRNFESTDSGLGTSFQDGAPEVTKSFQFVEPGQVSISPVIACTPVNKKSVKTTLFHSPMLNSNDEEFVEFLDIASIEGESLPVNFGTLISGSIISQNNTPKNLVSSRKARSRLFQSPGKENQEKAKTPVLGKRLKNPDSCDYIEVKRQKCFSDNNIHDVTMEECVPIRTTGQQVETTTVDSCGDSRLSPNSIMSAVQRSASNPDLIGDFTKPFALPLISGRHADLKSIAPSTLARLIRGEFSQSITSFKVIDCRYPYEFEGGHIVGALNLYKKEQIMNELFNPMKENSPLKHQKERNIVIFHCEFSSQRGPSLFRYLREIDRNHNNDFYPALHYPEIYLLDGGYKGFYEKFGELCYPNAYRTMNDPAHTEDYRHFRSQAQNRTRKMSKRCIF